MTSSTLNERRLWESEFLFKQANIFFFFIREPYRLMAGQVVIFRPQVHLQSTYF